MTNKQDKRADATPSWSISCCAYFIFLKIRIECKKVHPRYTSTGFLKVNSILMVSLNTSSLMMQSGPLTSTQ